MAIRRPGRTACVAIALVGVAMGVFALVRSIDVARRTGDGPIIDAPGTTRVHLDEGRWILFERTGTVANDGFASDLVTISIDDVTVTSLDGRNIGVRGVTGTQTVDRNGDHFIGAVEFVVPTTGDFDIDVRAGNRRALIARPLTDTLRGVVPWVLLGIAGLVVIVVGIVLAVLPRGAPVPARAAPSGPSPGWYPDPSGAPLRRWWDGTRWTDATAPWS